MSEEVRMPLHTEDARLSALYKYNILDTPTDPDYDNLTRLASQIFKVPFAFITFIDEHRQWIKSSVGSDVKETPRKVSFCQYTIRNSTVLVVEDTLLDSRFVDHPGVTDHRIFVFTREHR
jgi:GAF domain-containing protein